MGKTVNQRCYWLLRALLADNAHIATTDYDIYFLVFTPQNKQLLFQMWFLERIQYFFISEIINSQWIYVWFPLQRFVLMNIYFFLFYILFYWWIYQGILKFKCNSIFQKKKETKMNFAVYLKLQFGFKMFVSFLEFRMFYKYGPYNFFI